MLQAIRERAQGWIAWTIVILISIPFALWGIQSYLGVGSEPVIATVNGVDITERDFHYRYEDVRQRMREEMGGAYRPELLDNLGMRARVLDQMIRETLLLDVSADLGLYASDREIQGAIMANPAFQTDGRFDHAAYARTLELQGMRPVQYEDRLRQRIVGTQLPRAVTFSELTTERELAERVRLLRQQRRVSQITFPASAFAGEPPTEAEITAYYEAHEGEYRVPERVKVRWLALDADHLTPPERADEAELLALYEAEQARFGRPERRRVEHILVQVPPKADAAALAAARARVDALRARIVAGEDFAAVAKSASEDPGSAAQGGDLGFFERGLMDPAFDAAAFSLDPGVLSEPVQSQFGLHLLRVVAIEPAALKPFEEVKATLAEEARRREAERIYYDYAERLATLVYETPDSLDPAAEALGLKLETSDWINRGGGGPGVLADPRVVAAAFSDEVLKEGRNSELIEPERNRMLAVSVRVVEHQEASVKPLAEVRDAVIASLNAERAKVAAKAMADEVAERLRRGEDAALPEFVKPAAPAELIGRNATQVPQPVATLAFELPRPTDGKSRYGSLSLPGGDAVVVILSEVIDGVLETQPAAQRQQERLAAARAAGEHYSDTLLDDLTQRAAIERKPLPEAAATE